MLEQQRLAWEGKPFETVPTAVVGQVNEDFFDDILKGRTGDQYSGSWEHGEFAGRPPAHVRAMNGLFGDISQMEQRRYGSHIGRILGVTVVNSTVAAMNDPATVENLSQAMHMDTQVGNAGSPSRFMPAKFLIVGSMSTETPESGISVPGNPEMDDQKNELKWMSRSGQNAWFKRMASGFDPHIPKEARQRFAPGTIIRIAGLHAAPNPADYPDIAPETKRALVSIGSLHS